jgi:hypothetical protein
MSSSITGPFTRMPRPIATPVKSTPRRARPATRSQMPCIAASTQVVSGTSNMIALANRPK